MRTEGSYTGQYLRKVLDGVEKRVPAMSGDS